MVLLFRSGAPSISEQAPAPDAVDLTELHRMNDVLVAPLQ